MPDPAILLVTSDGSVIEPFRVAARAHNRKVIWSESGPEALKQLKRAPVCVVVADNTIGDGACGIEFLRQMETAAPFAVRMLMLPPEAPLDRAVDALNSGQVARFIPKPITDVGTVTRLLRDGIAAFAMDEQEREAVENLHYIVNGKTGGSNPRTLQIERLCTMGEMAGSLIHKFNNTLTIMMGHLDLLLDEVQGTDMEKRLQLISQAASDGVDLARTLQEFIRTGPTERETLSLNSVLTETIRLTEPIWKGKGSERHGRADLDVVSDLGSVPNIHGNLPELREVFTNLILNAVDAMPNGGRILVSTRNVSGRVQVRIQDTGIGMAPDIRERIFQPFFTTKGEEGNGLGLSIVQRIVHDHGGRIDVVSEQGIGTTFVVDLPQTAFAPADLAAATAGPSLS